MKITLSLYFILLSFNFAVQNRDKILSDFFSEKGEESIYHFVEQFDYHLLKRYNETDISSAYAAFFCGLRETKTASAYNDQLSFLNKKRDALLQILEKEAVSQIWKMSSCNSFSINYNGDYMNFLKELGVGNAILYEYFNSILVAGDISPSGVSFLNENQGELDVSDVQVRFVLAVHYLSISKPPVMRN